MQYRHLFPMVRILLPFMAGIVVSVAISATTGIPVLIWIILLMLSVVTGIINFRKLRIINRWPFGIIVSLFLFVSGYNSVILHKEILQPKHFANISTKGIFIASVAEPLQEKDHSYKTILRVRGLKKGNTFIEAEGRILTYFAKDSAIKPPAEGSLITFSADVQPIAPPQNPGAFDYRKYMAANNVYHQVYLNTYSWKLLESPQGFSLSRLAHKISQKFISTLHDNGLKGKEFAVASALLLGHKDMLDNETLQDYSGAGVMHILCVSGLHVGVIFMIVSFLLGFMKKRGSQLVFKTFLILITIWAYSLLTGLSPSVMRAATMFSFISIGNASRRYVHIINSLAVSAMFLLLINPLVISNIGFQLSYLAILGIVFINKPIAGLWNPTNRIASYAWGLIAVSIAAQIATTPLALLYFHQFPLYFIPANLVAVPVSFLAIYAGVAVLLTSFIPVISNVFGLLTNILLYILNHAVGFIEGLPYSVLRTSVIFSTESILIYLMIVSTLLLFYFKKKEMLFVLLFLGLLLSVSLTTTEISRKEQQKIIFYSTGKQSAIGFITGKKQVLLADSILIKDKKANTFQFDGAKSLFGLSTAKIFALDTISKFNQNLQKEFIPLYNHGKYLLFGNKRLVVIESLPKSFSQCTKLKVDYLFIKGNPSLRVSDLLKLYQPELIVIDGSNSLYRTEKWLAELKQVKLNAYSIKNSGALVVNL